MWFNAISESLIAIPVKGEFILTQKLVFCADVWF